MTPRSRTAGAIRSCAFWRNVTNSLPRTSTADARASVRIVAPDASCMPAFAGRCPLVSITVTTPLASLTVHGPSCA